MTNITLNQLEPQLTQRLQQCANQNGSTIEAEVTAILANLLVWMIEALDREAKRLGITRQLSKFGLLIALQTLLADTTC